MKTFGYIDFPPATIQPFPGDQIPGNFGVPGPVLPRGISLGGGEQPPGTGFQIPVIGSLGGGAIRAQPLPPLETPILVINPQPFMAPDNVLTIFRGQGGDVLDLGGTLRPQPSEVPSLDLGFRPQPSQVTGEVQTLQTTREFRPRQEVQTLDQGNIQTGQGGQSREITTTTGQQSGGQQTLETIEQSRQEFQSGHFQDPPGELDYVAPGPSVMSGKTTATQGENPQPCATCSMLNQDPNARDSYPVEMIFHFKNHASAQRLGGLCEADGECEIA